MELIIEILTCVAVGGLLRFKCVSKEWKLLIEGRYFVRKHLYLSLSGSFLVAEQHPFAALQSCDGLILEKHKLSWEFPIRNPAMRQVFYIPNPHQRNRVLLFGFAPTSGFYKLISIYDSDLSGNGYGGLEILLLGNEDKPSWKHVDSTHLQSLDKNDLLRTPIVEGVVRIAKISLIQSRNHRVMSFDLDTESFRGHKLVSRSVFPDGFAVSLARGDEFPFLVALANDELHILGFKNCLQEVPPSPPSTPQFHVPPFLLDCLSSKQPTSIHHRDLFNPSFILKPSPFIPSIINTPPLLPLPTTAPKNTAAPLLYPLTPTFHTIHKHTPPLLPLPAPKNIAAPPSSLTSTPNHQNPQIPTPKPQQSSKWNRKQIANITESQHVTNLYIQNLPLQWSAVELHFILSKFGEVIDVFIPSKRTKNDKRFGFVRYRACRDIQRLISSINLIKVANGSLQALIARGRDHLHQNHTSSKTPKTLPYPPSSFEKSFADTLRNVTPPCPKASYDKANISFPTLKSDIEWLSSCVFGVLSEPIETHVVLQSFLKHGYPVTVSDFGGTSVIINFLSPKDLSTFFESNHA
ncbi:hypothetical protein Tsubulata_038014 [Turnera subulata]|uniref:RRM domain-containing protein n=1 Tax=Turnera subulata TaxID=218843 RepID=A0A9Q0GCS5_9ROSI|nr:hypothetical protein Tsubulata_038014 [Turnera subulata]